MNRAFYIIVVPAILTSFGWLTFGWGLKFAAEVTAVEIVVVLGIIIFLFRRKNGQKSEPKKA